VTLCEFLVVKLLPSTGLANSKFLFFKDLLVLLIGAGGIRSCSSGTSIVRFLFLIKLMYFCFGWVLVVCTDRLFLEAKFYQTKILPDFWFLTIMTGGLVG
jgi:hypothetical protein